MRRALILAAMVTLTACDRQDGYRFERKEFERTQPAITVVTHPSLADLRAKAPASAIEPGRDLMGWSIILFLPVLPVSLPGPLFLLMLAGGVCYSAGLVFFAGKHRYSHVIWHVFVNGGALCHLAALVWLR